MNLRSFSALLLSNKILVAALPSNEAGAQLEQGLRAEGDRRVRGGRATSARTGPTGSRIRWHWAFTVLIHISPICYIYRVLSSAFFNLFLLLSVALLLMFDLTIDVCSLLATRDTGIICGTGNGVCDPRTVDGRQAGGK